MKRVLAIVRSHKLDEVTGALGLIGIKGVTITEAYGGGQRQHTYNYRKM